MKVRVIDDNKISVILYIVASTLYVLSYLFAFEGSGNPEMGFFPLLVAMYSISFSFILSALLEIPNCIIRKKPYAKSFLFSLTSAIILFLIMVVTFYIVMYVKTLTL